MSGTLNKGSLIKSSGGSGGGGSAKFPTIVTDSGSSLPVDLSGYQEGDTFLNTSDKKIYQAGYFGYVANTNTTLTVNVDYTTGIASGFTGVDNKSCDRTGLLNLWYGTTEILHSFKFKVSTIQTTPIVMIYSTTSTPYDYAIFYVSNDGYIHHKRYNWNMGYSDIFDNKILDTEIVSNKIYLLNITKTGTNCVAQLTDENGTILEEKNFTTTDLVRANNSISYGVGRIGDNIYSSNLSVYLGQSAGELVIPNTSTLSWDSGTSLTDKTEYADKTNGALYLYENSELVKIGGSLTKKVYTISADNTSTLDVSSDFTKVVDVLKNGVELALTDDYTISSGVITFVTALSTTDKITVKGE